MDGDMSVTDPRMASPLLLGRCSLRQTRPCLEQMTNHIRHKSKVTAEGTRQPDGPDLVALLGAVPAEDWYRTWAACRTIMFRRTSKRVKEQVDKMRLPVLVRLCRQLWRDIITTRLGDYNGGRYNRVMENINIVMNQIPVMTALFRMTTLELDGLVAPDIAAATFTHTDRAPESLTEMLQGVIGRSAGWLTHVDLDGNSFGSEGVSRLAGVLAECTSLRYLGLGANSVQDDGVENVARVLHQCPALRTLDLHNLIGCHGAGGLARVLVVCTALTKLDLAFNCIADCGAENIAAVLGECPPLGYLYLDLQENEIGPEHCRRLSAFCTGTLDIILDDSTSEEDEEEVEDLND
jgi:hypothetical protein